MRRKAVWAGTLFAAAAALTIAACGGGGGGTPTTPTPNPGGGGSSTTTITIGADGRVSPQTITVPVGSRVTFTNNHTRPHDMQSDPHPVHTDCPELDTVGFLQPGQSKQTENLTRARTCGYHDHGEDVNTNLQGRIIIQ